MRKKLWAILLVVTMLVAFAVPAMAADNTIYLKGDQKGNFTEEWNDVFYLGGAEDLEDPQVWHLVYSEDVNNVSHMQLDFGDNGIWEWNSGAGFSTNGGGNNPGWVVAAPADWVLAYVNSGNGNVSDSYVIASDNGQFNISGYHKGGGGGGRDYEGGIELEKFVNGINIVTWAEDNGYDITDLIECFNLYTVDADGASIEGLTPFMSDNVNLFSGILLFGGLDDGWYAVEEVLTVAGEAVFEQAPVMYILIANGITFGGAMNVDFDYFAYYTIVNGYGQGYELGYTNGVRNDLLNDDGDIFPIAVTNEDTGVSYPSFCALGGATAFANGYMVAEKMVDYADFALAYNFIEANYGNLNTYRALTQIVTWVLLGAIDIDSDAFDNINWAQIESGKGSIAGVPDAKASVLDVIANYADCGLQSPIVDVVYMLDRNGGDVHNNQPQLVPVYGEGRGFDNTTKTFVQGSVTFDKEVLTAEGTLPADPGAFEFALYAVLEDDDFEYIGTYETQFGGVILAEKLEPGLYAFFEVPQDGWVLDNYKDGLFFEIIDETTTIWITAGPLNDEGNPVVLNVALGSLKINTSAQLTTIYENWKKIFERERTPYKTISPSYGSVTATNVDYKGSLTLDKKGNNYEGYPVVENSNHFTYAKLDKAALEDGIDLAMVVGNNIDQCGTAFVQLVDGKLEITINDMYSGSFGAVAFQGFMPTVKNGNIHSIGIFDHNSKGAQATIEIFGLTSFQSKDKKGANYDKDWADITKNKKDDGFIYLYIHGDFVFDLTDKNDLKYDKDVGGIWGDWSEYKQVGEERIKVTLITSLPLALDVDVVVTDADGNPVFDDTISANRLGLGNVVIPDLLPGEYTVSWSWSYAGGDPDSGAASDTIIVVAGEQTTLTIPKIFISKTVKTYLSAFDVYNDIENPLVIKK